MIVKRKYANSIETEIGGCAKCHYLLRISRITPQYKLIRTRYSLGYVSVTRIGSIVPMIGHFYP